MFIQILPKSSVVVVNQQWRHKSASHVKIFHLVLTLSDQDSQTFGIDGTQPATAERESCLGGLGPCRKC